MSDLLDVISCLEEIGGKLTLDGNRIRYRIPKDHPKAQALLIAARAEKQAILAYLRARTKGVRLLEWNLKEPPVAIESCAIVTDTARFARNTLEQLRTALAEPKRWVGWSVPQLIDRLAQVGVRVSLES
jgi:hypothetical protein